MICAKNTIISMYWLIIASDITHKKCLGKYCERIVNNDCQL